MSLAGVRAQVSSGRHTRFDAGITGAVFSQSGLLGVALGDGTLEIVMPGGMAETAPAHEGAILRLVLDVDGRGFVTGGDDGRVVRTSASGACSTLVDVPGRQIDVVAVSRAAATIANGIGKEVRLFDAEGRERGGTGDHPSTVTGLAFNAKGKRLAASHYGGVTLWWTSMIGHNQTRLKWRGSHIDVSWSPDGTHVVSAMQERELHAWRVSDGDDMAMRGYAAKVRCTDWRAKPMMLATGGADCVVAWLFSGSGPRGKPPLEVGRGIGQLVTHVAVHPSRPLVAAGFDDGRVALCELGARDEDRPLRLRPGDGSKVSALAWSADGCKLAVGTDRGALGLFDLALGS